MMEKIILEINGYRAEFNKNEKAGERARRFFEEEIPKMEFEDIHDLVSYVYALGQYANEFLEIIMGELPVSGSD
jgi:hypothetical protein